jgi:hypothetical protein
LSNDYAGAGSTFARGEAPPASSPAGVRVPVIDERHGLDMVWVVRNPDWAELLGPGAGIVIRAVA